MSDYTWIHEALAAGGTLTLRRACGKYIRATMSWPGEEPVSGDAKGSVTLALGELETALADDCANEMLNSGAV